MYNQLCVYVEASVKSFEHMDITVTSKSSSCRLYIVYRPPYSKKNKQITKMFFSDFLILLELINNISGRTLLAGDFNVHMDNLQDTDASTFKNLLSLAGFTQHVTGSTHKMGHTLDLLITRDADEAISDITIHSDLPSDHFVTSCYLNISRPDAVKHKISFRKLHQIDIVCFKSDIMKLQLNATTASDIDSGFANYNSTLSQLLNVHALLVTRSITLRPHAPWYDKELR